MGNTNNDPKIVAGYFVQYLQKAGGAPRCVRIDAGTENSIITQIQKSLVPDDCDHPAVIIGSSHGNQVLEFQLFLNSYPRNCYKCIAIYYFIHNEINHNLFM